MIVGRVAAIINHRANATWNKKSVRFGWIDFIDDIDVSRALLEAVERFFEDPENEKAFQEWKEEREAQLNEAAAG